MTAPTILDVTDVVAGYGQTKVLKELSLVVHAGEAVAVVGANGAGKTTLMATIAGLIDPWSGSITLDGADVTAVPAEDRAQGGIALAPEGRLIFASLTIEENLIIGATCLRRRLGSRVAQRRIANGLDRVYQTFGVLKRRRNAMGSHLSGGQQQMLAIGRAMMAEPKILLLDEPCLGLAPRVADEVYDVLRHVRQLGQSIVVVEESSRRALNFVDRVCVVALGQKILDQPAAAVGHDDDLLLSAYFGIDAGGKHD